MVDNHDGQPLNPQALLLFQKLREQWQRDIRDALRLLDPYAPQGRLGPSSLPPNVVRNTGDYNPAATYRKGDIVRGSDGRDYYTIVAGSTGLEPSTHPSAFRPVEGWNEAHTHDGTTENGVPLDALHTHQAVILGAATGAIHWTAAALVALLGAAEPFGVVFTSEGDVVYDELGKVVTKTTT